MVEFNPNQMTEEDLIEAANKIFTIQEKDFERIKSEKWYKTLFHAITLNQDGKKYAVRGINSLAKLQQLFMSIYVKNYRTSYKDLNETINVVTKNSEAIKKLFGMCVLNLEGQEDLGVLDPQDAEILALFLGEYRDANGAVPVAVQSYNRGVLNAIHQKVPIGVLDNHQIRRLKAPKVVYRCFMEQCAVDGTIDSQEWTDQVYQDLRDFELSENSKNEIKQSVKYESEIAGVEYFIVKYTKDNIGVLDSDFDIDIQASIDLAETEKVELMCETNDEVDTSISREPLILSGIISIEKKQVYENKIIHFSSAIIECTAEVEFRNCTIHYNEDDSSRITLKKEASLTILGSTVACHGRGPNEKTFITSQSADACKIKSSCFVDCVDFLSGYFSTFLFSENECCDCCLRFLDIEAVEHKNVTIESCNFLFAVEPTFAHIDQSGFHETCISISASHYSFDEADKEDNIRITGCIVACVSGEDGTPCTYMDAVDFIRLSARNAQVGFCTFTDIKNCIHNCIHGSAFIYNCIFKRCQNVIIWGTCVILDNQFIACVRVAQDLEEGSQIKNCQFYGGGQKEYITGKGIEIEACEFVGLHSNGGDSGIIELENFHGSRAGAKKLKTTRISKCVFSGIRLESGKTFIGFGPSFLIAVHSYGDDPHRSLVDVSDCIFRNCATDNQSGEIIRQKNTHYGSFNRVTTFQVIGIGDCIGYDQTTDLEHYMMTTDFELKQVDGEGRSFGCNQELELPSREDCLKVKEELIRDEKS